MTEGQHRVFAQLPGEQRIRLLEEACDLLKRYGGCGEPRCAVDCERCTEVMMDHLVALMARDGRARNPPRWGAER